MERRKCYKDVLLFTAMVSVECSNIGLNTLFKAATLKGMSYYVFIFYSYAIATLVLLPLSFIFRSATVLPSSKFPLVSRICLLSVIGVLGQILGYKGIAYSSPTLASAIGNLIPAFTFTLAIIFRLEKLNLRSLSMKAKIIGTIVSISGALVVVLYKGPTILSTSYSAVPSMPLRWTMGSSQPNWIIGSLLLAAQYLLLSIWYIIQTQVMSIYPAELVVVFFNNLCATIISAPVCFMQERHSSAWILKPDVTLVAIVYSGCFGSCFSTAVHTFGLRFKGPVYIGIFKPLSIPIAAAMSVIFLDEALHLGCVIGAVIIAIGFYSVLWGQARDERLSEDSGFSSLEAYSSSKKTPLLQSVEDT